MFCFEIMSYYFYLLFIFVKLGNTIEINDFYKYDNSFLLLESGADKSAYRKLPTSLNFFSEIYDHIYINTQGILTFNNGLNGFENVPLPLEYAAIAPFYSNVDTSNAGPNSFISLSIMDSEENSRKAYNVIQRNFVLKNDFHISNVIIATWMNVGHYQMNNTAQNTFQVAIINSELDTFIQFLYPINGLNWLQGDFGESGLPDIRAQAGFGAEDGRFFLLPGSGSENSKYLSELSNHGVPGSWIYRVGYIGFEDNIQQPFEAQEEQHKKYDPETCENGGKLKCHASATCHNYRNGFQCKCNVGFYGNGIDCIKNDVPIRVSGKVSGKIGNSDIEAQIQSYVILSDGRSYTAVSPINFDVGYKSQLGYTLGYVIGWLFAKPVSSDDVLNGYQITGGKLKSTISIRYMDGDHTDNESELRIVQNFNGLNVWDQLAVNIEINGNLPDVPPAATIIFSDASDTYILNAENGIRSEGNGQILIDQRNISFVITQTINFGTPIGSTLHLENKSIPIFNKVSKITSHYQNNEKALRIGMINKVVGNTAINPCTDGTAMCGQNSICIPHPQHDSYSCECRNGFSLDETESSCVDIDECSTNANICDRNADCYNELGGYSCRCRAGFHGNGRTCHSYTKIYTTEESFYDTTTVLMPNIPALAPNHWLCDQCSEHADCNQGVCVCRSGWNGNGIECVYNCPDEYVWNIDRCIPIASNADDEEDEIAPFCHSQGCSCQTGYELIEFNDSRICRLVEREEDDEKLPCDVENTCHQNANCIWIESELRNKCVCNPGYDGNGYKCEEHEVSCIVENICDVHASCVYDELIGKSVCKCDKKYEGDGKSCRIGPECLENENCSENTHCEAGACICNEGYERDSSDFCVPAGFCGGTYCANNAICLWDAEQFVQYCSCLDGFVGDGVQSCKSIPPTCNVENNCGLNAQCLLKLDGIYECTCNNGFYADGLICVPEIDCFNLPSLCHENARCISTTSGYQCFCNSGFIGNGTFCQQPIRQENGFLLLSQGVAIVKIPFEGTRGSPIATSSMGIGLDTDCSTNRVFWCDISAKQILSSKYDGSDKKVFIDEDIVSPEGIAIDWISRRIYWTDSSKDTIEVASLEDSKVRAVIIRSGLVNPRGIAVDPHQSKLYFSDWNRDGPKIEQSNLDGTNRKVLLSSPAVILPNSLAILASTGELCFADAGTHKVECLEPFQKTVRTIATELPYPFGIAIANERLYWTDWTTKKIEISDSIGNRFPGISSSLFGNHKMYGMTSVGTECSVFYNPCQVNNGDCASNTICLVTSNAPSGKHCQQISQL